MSVLWTAATLFVGLLAGVPAPPPPSPPKRSAHAVLRGEAPPAVRGHGVFREIGTTVQLVLTASDSLAGTKEVSLLSPGSCETLEAVGDDARRLGRLVIDDEGRGRMTARLAGVSIDPTAPNTIIDALLVIHVGDEVKSCGDVRLGRLGGDESRAAR